MTMNEKEKQIEEMACENCLHHYACVVNSEYVPSPCRAYESKAGYRKQSGWISVEERLPEPYTWVTVYNPNGKYTKIDADEIVGGNWVRHCGKVTHWMPLPEPPKGE